MIQTERTFNIQKQSLEEPDALHNEIQRDLLALDLRISLFVGAALSFKYDSLLKPIPAAFRKNDGEVAIEEIRNLIHKLPELDAGEKPNSEISSFLRMMVLNNQQKLTTISIGDLKSKTDGHIELQIAPRWIFEIEHTSRNQAWERRKADSSTFYAYHGSRFENFHSILNLGLHQHLNKVNFFQSKECVLLTIKRLLNNFIFFL